jgi:hypothetical protein
MKNLKINIRVPNTRAIYIFCAISLLISLLAPIVGLIISFFIITLLIRRNFSLPILIPSILSLACIASFIMLLSVAIEVIGPNFKQYTIINVCIALLNVFLLFLNKTLFFSTRSIKLTFFPKKEWIITSIFIFVFLWVVSPVITSPNSVNLFSNLYAAEDNSAHLGLINYNIAYQSPTYLNDNTGLIETLNTYPQGAHSSIAYLYWTLLGSKASYHSLGILFLIYTFMWAFLAAAFVYVTLILLLRINNARLPYSLVLLTGLFIYFLVVQYFIDYGFFTQLIAFLALAIQMLLLFQYYKNKRNADTVFVLCSLSCLVIIAMAWYVLLFVALFPLVLFYKQFLKVPKYIYIIYAFATFAILFLVYISSTSLSGANALLQTGAVHTYSTQS